jgi:hypothetical protein
MSDAATTAKSATPAIIKQVHELPLPAKLFNNTIKAEIAAAVEALRAVPQIETEDDKAKVEAAIKAAQKITKVAGDKRLEVTRIFDEAKKLFMQAEGDALAELSPELKTALNNVTEYNRRKLAEQRAAEALALEAANKELARKRAPASIAKVEVATQTTLNSIATEHKTGGMRTVWKGDITNAAAVPREYCSPDPAKIAAAVAAGVRVIAGVNIYEDVRRTGK